MQWRKLKELQYEAGEIKTTAQSLLQNHFSIAVSLFQLCPPFRTKGNSHTALFCKSVC